MKLKLKFPFSNDLCVLKLNNIPTKFKETNLLMTALVTNKKWPFHFPWCRALVVHPPLREGCHSALTHNILHCNVKRGLVNMLIRQRFEGLNGLPYVVFLLKI